MQALLPFPKGYTVSGPYYIKSVGVITHLPTARMLRHDPVKVLVGHSIRVKVFRRFAPYFGISLSFAQENHNMVVRFDSISSAIDGDDVMRYIRVYLFLDDGHRGRNAGRFSKDGIQVLELGDIFDLDRSGANDFVNLLLRLQIRMGVLQQIGHGK